MSIGHQAASLLEAGSEVPAGGRVELDVARRLHNTVGQGLVTLALGLEDLRTRVDGSIAARVEALHAQTRQALDELRAAMAALLGHDPADETAERAQEELATRMLDLAEGGTSVRLACNVSLDTLPAAASLCLCRIGAEALRNVQRHAHARRVSLRLERRRDRVTLVVSDDGQGLLAGPRAGSGYGGLGIAIVRRQAEQLGGWLRIDSTGGRGTRLTASVPLYRRASPVRSALTGGKGKRSVHGRA